MAPSKHKQKSKPKRKTSSPPATRKYDLPKDEGFSADVANAGDWNTVVSRLCEYLKLPGMCCLCLPSLCSLALFTDLTSRRGLKKVHQDFDKIFEALDGLYETYNDDDRVVGAVVGIYAKLCADSILGKRLFKQGKRSFL